MDERLIGVIHLPPLPGSPRYAGDVERIADAAGRDAAALEAAGFDGVMVENFGDAPFARGSVEAVTVASMTRCALRVVEAAPRLSLGINVLRNDAASALAIAAATGATMVRVNVHTGACLTDQGVVEGDAFHTLRRRRALGLDRVRLLCDVAVKHAAPLAPRPLAEEAEETYERGLADALLVTGSGTGREASLDDLGAVLRAVEAPVLLASGVTPERLGDLFAERAGRRPHGAIVGSWLRAGGRAGGPIDRDRAARFAESFRQALS